nr:MAG TPA: hypothetical protein [Bacteriophage sp.]
MCINNCSSRQIWSFNPCYFYSRSVYCLLYI